MKVSLMPEVVVELVGSDYLAYIPGSREVVRVPHEANGLIRRALTSSRVSTEPAPVVLSLLQQGILRREGGEPAVTRRHAVLGGIGLGTVAAMSLPVAAVASSVEETFLAGRWRWGEWGTNGMVLDGNRFELITEVRFRGDRFVQDLNGQWDLTLDPDSPITLSNSPVRILIEEDEFDVDNVRLNTDPENRLFLSPPMPLLTGTIVSRSPGGPTFRVRFSYSGTAGS